VHKNNHYMTYMLQPQSNNRSLKHVTIIQQIQWSWEHVSQLHRRPSTHTQHTSCCCNYYYYIVSQKMCHPIV